MEDILELADRGRIPDQSPLREVVQCGGEGAALVDFACAPVDECCLEPAGDVFSSRVLHRDGIGLVGDLHRIGACPLVRYPRVERNVLGEREGVVLLLKTMEVLV